MGSGHVIKSLKSRERESVAAIRLVASSALEVFEESRARISSRRSAALLRERALALTSS